VGPKRHNTTCNLYDQQIALEYVGDHVIASAAELVLLFSSSALLISLQFFEFNLAMIMALHGSKIMPWGYRWRSSRWLILSTMTIALFAGKILIPHLIVPECFINRGIKRHSYLDF